MPRTLKLWFQIGSGFVLLAVIAHFLLKFVEMFFIFLQSVNPTVGAAIVAAVATVMIEIYTQYLLKKRQMDDVHREKKIQIYEEFRRNWGQVQEELGSGLEEELGSGRGGIGVRSRVIAFCIVSRPDPNSLDLTPILSARAVNQGAGLEWMPRT